MMTSKRQKAVAYLRVSTEMQVEGYSLAAQMESIERYTNAYGIDIVGVYKDEGKSGKSIEGREDFIRMLNDIETKPLSVDYVLVYKLSRFGRNAADVLATLQRLQDWGTNLICTEDRLDSSTGSGKLMIAVISAVAEIERVNILEHTMGGRKSKAREGLWNGGFAPVGYMIVEDKLEIEETEAVAIRIIYDKYINTDMGYNGIAKYLNRQGIIKAKRELTKKKVPPKNITLTQWSAKMVRDVLDNPVYKGTIAYGRRIKEKVEGTRAEYRQVKNNEPILVHNAHKGIVSVEDWEAARAKREQTGGKTPSTIGRDRIHLLSGILRCPECGGPMYTNRNSWTKKDGTYVEHNYYTCSRNRLEVGKACSYKASLRKDTIEPDVLSAIRVLVKDEAFAADLKSKIGKEIDTAEIDREIKKYEESLKQRIMVKLTIEREKDEMPYDEQHWDRKQQDLKIRHDRAYNEIVALEKVIDDLSKKRQAIENNVLNLQQVYQLLQNFDLLYNRLTEEEQRKLVAYLIESIEIYKEPVGREMSRLKSITFTFPVSYGGEVSDKVLWDKETQVEAIILMTRSGSGEKK